MPLVSQQFAPRDHVQSVKAQSRASVASSILAHYEESYSNMKEDTENKIVDNRMGLNKVDSKNGFEGPKIPQRSELRASGLLKKLNIPLDSFDKASVKRSKNTPIEADPHESYLSSEEDASEAADDYDESIIDLDAYSSDLSRPSTSHSYEITARAVSFIYFGKPQLIDIFSSDNSATSPSISDDDHRSLRRPTTSRANSSSNISYRPSTSRSSSLGPKQNFVEQAEAFSALRPLRPQGSRPSFLDIDPYPASEAQELASPVSSVESALPPRTPTSLANTALRTSFMRMSKGINMAKKKPSISKMGLQFKNGDARSSTTALPEGIHSSHLLADSGRNASMNNLSSKLSRLSQEHIPVMQEEQLVSAPATNKMLKMRASVLALGRRKSMKSEFI